MISIVVLLPESCASTDRPRSTACSLPPPSFLLSAQPGQIKIEAGSPTQIGFAAIDPSVIAIGFCSATRGLPVESPTLSLAGGSSRPFGGNQYGDQSRHGVYFLYPFSRQRHIVVAQDGVAIGAILFPSVGRDAPCKARTSSIEIQVIACGALTIVRWATGLQFSARSVDVIVGRVFSRETHDLGFYLTTRVDEASGLTIEFGFQTQRQGDLNVLISAVYLAGAVGNQLPHPVQEHIPIATTND